jgi:hypothetical protein
MSDQILAFSKGDIIATQKVLTVLILLLMIYLVNQKPPISVTKWNSDRRRFK